MNKCSAVILSHFVDPFQETIAMVTYYHVTNVNGCGYIMPGNCNIQGIHIFVLISSGILVTNALVHINIWNKKQNKQLIKMILPKVILNTVKSIKAKIYFISLFVISIYYLYTDYIMFIFFIVIIFFTITIVFLLQSQANIKNLTTMYICIFLLRSPGCVRYAFTAQSILAYQFLLCGSLNVIILHFQVKILVIESRQVRLQFALVQLIVEVEPADWSHCKILLHLKKPVLLLITGNFLKIKRNWIIDTFFA